jgi:hypothetical protein
MRAMREQLKRGEEPASSQNLRCGTVTKSQPRGKRSLRYREPVNAVSRRSYSPTMANCFVVITA